MRTPKKLPTTNTLVNLFTVDENMGVLIRKSNNKEVVCNGRTQIYVEGERYLISRILWKIYTGEDPGCYIVEHKDCNPTNNTRENLRLADRTQNQANIRKRKSSKYLKGAHKCGDKFRARIKISGKSIHLGMFDTQEEAHRAYKTKSIELFGEFSRSE